MFRNNCLLYTALNPALIKTNAANSLLFRARRANERVLYESTEAVYIKAVFHNGEIYIRRNLF